MTQTTVNVAADDEMMDFSLERASIKFRVDDDVFEAVPDIAAELAMEYAEKIERLQRSDGDDDEHVDMQAQKEIIYSTLRLVLYEESAERFIARLSDQRRPIGQVRFGNITTWLLEQYGMRPTTSDSASSTGSESQDAGTSSTASTSDAAST